MREKITPIMELMLLFLISFAVVSSSVYAAGWSPDTRLTWSENDDFAPSIAQVNDEIWIVWHSYIKSNGEIFYKTYNKSSTNPWSSNIRLTTNSNLDVIPSIKQTADGRVWVVWSSNRTGDFEIFYKIYDGSVWSSDKRLTYNKSKDENPSITQDMNGRVWVVWSSNRTGDYAIFYKVYDGSVWSPDTRLTSYKESKDDLDPCIIQAADGNFWLVWVRKNVLFYKVFCWKNEAIVEVLPETRLTFASGVVDLDPCVTQLKNGIILVVWSSDRIFYQDDIYFKTYNGASWSDDQRLTTDMADDFLPSVTQTADGTIWVTWTSTRLNNFDIYYKTDSPPQYPDDVAIVSVTHNPNIAIVYQGLNISIEVVPQNHGAKDEYITVNCYVNSTLLGSKITHLSAGQLLPLMFTWNTKNVNPGNYVIRAEAIVVPGETDTADNILVDRTIQVRIPGDADFNGIVDVSDFAAWAGNFGKTAEKLLPDEYADFDNSGYVEMKDFPIWAANYGKHI